LDHLFLDQDAVPTFVEVKRSSDSRIRREVVGQMLDYAANAVVYWPIERIRAQFEAACDRRGTDPADKLLTFLDIESGTAADMDMFWQRAQVNLQAGRIRLLFVADEIPPGLRRIIEFLNAQMTPAEVLAIEIKQYATSNREPVLRTLVPRVIGQSITATDRKSATVATAQFTEAEFFGELTERLETVDVEVVKRVAAWARSRGSRFEFGKSTKHSTFHPCFDHLNVGYWPFAFRTDGNVEFITQYLGKRRPFDSDDAITKLFTQLNQIPGLALPFVISGKPRFRLEVLRNEPAFNQFLKVFQSIVDQIRSVTSQDAPI